MSLLIVTLASVIVSSAIAQPQDKNPTPNPVVTPAAGWTSITVTDGDGLRWVWAWWNVPPYNDITNVHNPVNPYTFTTSRLNDWPAQGMIVQVEDQIGWVSVFWIQPNGQITRLNYFWTQVGGIVIPADKFALLAPYIGLTSTVAVAAVATVVYVKRVRRGREKQ